MLLTITTKLRPASDLGFLLHKHPDRRQSFDLSFGKAHVFYPEVCAERCSACLLLDVDPIGMVRGRNGKFALGQYVNDRPYVASSFMSVAIAQVLGSALQGRSKDRPDLATTPIPLTARLDVLPVRGGEGLQTRKKSLAGRPSWVSRDKRINEPSSRSSRNWEGISPLNMVLTVPTQRRNSPMPAFCPS